MNILDQIQTIVIVMMENRSFDHVLGHLSMAQYGNRKDIIGLINPETNPDYTNFLDSQGYQPFHLKDGPLPSDLPHSRDLVAVQLAKKDGQFTMRGFVDAYYQQTKRKVDVHLPMGFHTPEDVPISNFFANQYAVCDHWFAPIPTSTQPNRSVAYSGYALIDDTKAQMIPLVPGSFFFDWLSAHKVRWRNYHCGFSLFTLFDRLEDVLGPNFRSFKDLSADWESESLAAAPEVIFIEPEYTDSPIHFEQIPNDNHPPTSIGPGEHFLRDIYTILTHNPTKWQRTLLIVTYDEHGGFFDHIPPLTIPTPVPPKALYSVGFESTGPRVPAFVISPWIPPSMVFKGVLDHTSILQLLSEKFAGTPDYNEEVKRRKDLGIQSVSQVLIQAGLAQPRADIPASPQNTIFNATVPVSVPTPQTDNQRAFAAAAKRLLAHDYQQAVKKFPGITHLFEEM
ncbi:alkaline phosphatase family protein [Candidatus Nitrosoglobus terrae]|uniref:alkaline phosphatase family protein n=1 Tax=Candidatus Nitrosoglobus terrae TaxID=1630141 RepID=UPI0011AB31B4|nr:alkaline phosphatase family protein [Candidatus Nitrosoglobus terrae]